MSPKSPPKQRHFSPFLKQPDYIPSPLQLKPHQLSGLNRMLSNWQQKKPLILADEMGLGKTIQTIIMIQYLFHTHQLYPHVIIVPNSTLDNWEREFHLWAPELSVLQFSGDREDRESAKSYECFDDDNKLRFHCLITTYSTTRLELPFIKHCGPYASLTVDESHNLKNERSLLYQSVDAIQVDFKLFLTGTPVQNKIRELFALLNFLDPIEFDNINDLEAQYSDLSPDLVISLITRLKPYILRRTVGHIANELPPKREVIINCGLTALQKQLYKSVIDNNLGLLAALDHSKRGPRTDVFMQLMRISMHPYAVDADIEPRNLSPEEELRLLINSSGKYAILMQILHELHKDKSKVIIFAQHKRSLDILQDILYYSKYNYFRMDGDTKRQKRQSMFDAFNNDPTQFAFIMTTRCGSEGINLTAASTVILMDMDFNPTVDKQAIGRCYRIGQKNIVLAIKLVTTNTVDERRLEIATRKSTLNRLLVKPLDSEQDLKSNDIAMMIKHGAKKLFESDKDDAHIKLTTEELREYLDRSKASKTEEIEAEDDAFADGNGELLVMNKINETSIAVADIEDDTFWDQLIRAKMKEEEIRNAGVVLGRGMRKKNGLKLVDFTQESDRNKDADFVMMSSSEVDAEEMMVGDLMGEIENVNRGDAMRRLLQGVQQHRDCLQQMGLQRTEQAIGIRCWLCNESYHHLLSCGVIRDVGKLRAKMEEFKNKPHLRKMVERVLMIATG